MNLFRLPARIAAGWLAVAGWTLPAAEVAGLFDLPLPVWRLRPETLPEEWRAAAVLTGDETGSWRHYYLDAGEALTLVGLQAAEGDFHFGEAGLDRIELVIFTAGEPFNGGLTADEAVRRLRMALGPELEARPRFDFGHIVIHARYWQAAWGQLAMLWAANADGLAYLKIILTPQPCDVFEELSVPIGTAGLVRGSGRLAVAPVRQGDRQYCAAATLEMVLRYYGSRADQHLLAVWLGVDPDAGAQMEELAEAMKLLEEPLRASFRLVYVNDYFRDYSAIWNFLSLYNKWADIMKRRKLDLKSIRRRPPAEVRAWISTTLPKLDREVLLSIGNANDAGLKKFRREVARQIRRGVPLIWTALADSSDEQVAFHMLLVVGYNESRDRLEYIDPSKPGSGLQRMDIPAAWSLTNHLAVLTPSIDNFEKPIDEPETISLQRLL